MHFAFCLGGIPSVRKLSPTSCNCMASPPESELHQLAYGVQPLLYSCVPWIVLQVGGGGGAIDPLF